MFGAATKGEHCEIEKREVKMKGREAVGPRDYPKAPIGLISTGRAKGAYNTMMTRTVTNTNTIPISLSESFLMSFDYIWIPGSSLRLFPNMFLTATRLHSW